MNIKDIINSERYAQIMENLENIDCEVCGRELNIEYKKTEVYDTIKNSSDLDDAIESLNDIEFELECPGCKISSSLNDDIVEDMILELEEILN